MSPRLDKVQLLINEYNPAMQDACKDTGLFVSVCMAQFILETGYGKTIRKAARNLFGIKAGIKWPGKVASLSTCEFQNGKKIKYVGTGEIYNTRVDALKDNANPVTIFRAYDSYVDSILDRNDLLLHTLRYKPVLKALTSEDQCYQLKKCGYATAPQYDKVLISIIHSNNLTELDKK